MAVSPLLVVGASGQLALALARAAAVTEHPIVCRGRPEADLTSEPALQRLLDDLAPFAVVNAGAYTAVDKAEEEPDLAFAVNAAGPQTLARLCRERDLPLVHVSTDYVFDGGKQTPYAETDAIAPLGVYGASKAAGEDAIRRECPRHVIVRTSWLYSMDGHNFLTTMLRLGAVREELSVVDDQYGAPTFAGDVAGAICAIVRSLDAGRQEARWGTYHLASQGVTTWFGFASQIFRLAAAGGAKVPHLKPIAAADYPAKAVRPRYSALDTGKLQGAFGISLPRWQDSLARCFAQSVEQSGEHPGARAPGDQACEARS